MIACLDASALIYLVDGEAPWGSRTGRDAASAFWSVVWLRCGGAIKPAWTVFRRCLPSRICWLWSSVLLCWSWLRPPDAVMITGDAGFQRLQALQVRLIACSCRSIAGLVADRRSPKFQTQTSAAGVRTACTESGRG